MKNYKDPLVSIIMPSYNASSYINQAISSIVEQDYSNWELICVDDNSADNTYSLLQKYQTKDNRIRVFKNKKKEGIGFSLNRALGLARGEFIARMDADDISLPNRISKQVEILSGNKKLIACGGQVAIIDSKNDVIAYKKFPTDHESLYQMIMLFMPIQHPVIMVKKRIFKNYKYNTNLSTAEDVDLLFYLLEKGEITNLNSIIYLYRKCQSSNANHNIKKTFYLTFITRFKAIFKYGYRPSLLGIIFSIFQLALVSLIPQRLILRLFEMFRFDPKPISLEKIKKAFNYQKYTQTYYRQKANINPSI